MAFLKQVVALILSFAFAAFVVLVVLPKYPALPKILLPVVLVLSILTLPITLNRWKNVPRVKVLLLYSALFISLGGISLTDLFSLDPLVAFLGNCIGLFLLILFVRIKPNRPSVSSRN